MAPHLSAEMRERIVVWRNDQGRDVPDIALLAGCSTSTVYEVLRLHRTYGTPHNPFTIRRGRPRALDAGDLSYLMTLLQANPTLYLDEMQEKLQAERNVDVSIATICRALARLAQSHKRITREAAERDELLRATWQAAYGHIPKEYFLWLDESSVDDRTNHRSHGWSPLGRACVRREIFLRGKRYSVLPALSCEGIIAMDILEGSVTKDRFIQFVEEQILPILNPYPGRHSVVVLDNCAIHHDEAIRHLIEDECGAKLVYLPPYSPDFNPIEQAFHNMKQWLRRNEAQVVNAAVRPWLIQQAAMSITPELAVSFAENCGPRMARGDEM